MTFNYYLKKNRLILVVLLFFIAVNGFFCESRAENARSPINPDKKEKILVIPLTITADEKTEKAVRGSIEKFFLQRLNNSKLVAKASLVLSGSSDETLSAVYSSLNSGIVDQKLNSDGDIGYICGGSVVVLGDSVVADFFLFNVQSRKKTIESNASGNNIGKILTLADLFTKRINALFSPLAADRLSIKTAQDSNSVVTGAEVNSAKKLFIKSDKINGEITSVVFCRLDDTGNAYAVYSLFDRIVVVEIKENSFVEKLSYTNEKSEKIIGLTAVDTDQDGKEELVVSNIKSDNRTISSYVLKYKNNRLDKTLSGLKWIFSSALSDDKSERGLVYAQKHKTMKSTLDSGILRVRFNNGQMEVADKPMALPGWVQLPGLAVNPGSDMAYSVAYSPDSRLNVFDKKQELFWESPEVFGGATTYLSEKDPLERDIDHRIWLNPPVRFAELYKGNKYKEIIAVKNKDSTKKLFARVRSYKEGRITIFSMNDLTCRLVGETDKITGHISGFDVKLSEKDRDASLLYSVVQKGKSVFPKKRSYLVVQNVNSLKKGN